MIRATEFEFVLPHGYVDGQGNVAREGVMRMATASDEILPMKDPRVQANPGYLVVIMLARVILRLGDISPINPKIVEGLFAADLAYLQDMYVRINKTGNNRVSMTCPHCEGQFEAEVCSLGG